MTSSKLPTITWETGIRHEALRTLYYLKRLPEQELQNRGFHVLPVPPHNNQHICIIIPENDYSSFWKSASKLVPTTPMTAPEKLIEEMSQLLAPAYHQPPTHFLQLSNIFFTRLFSFFPKYDHIINNINLVVTYCGTSSQFNTVDNHQDNLTIYIRPDTRTTDIYRVIILSLIRNQLQHQENRSWEEVESIADFILHHSILSTLVDKSHRPIMTSLQKIQSNKLHKESQKYLAKLGIPNHNNWQISNNQIYFGTAKIQRLTLRQTNIMKLLISNYGQIVSNDQLANTLWPNNEDFSLWAIVKEMARIRQHLISSGVSGHNLKSHRKQGYSLN